MKVHLTLAALAALPVPVHAQEAPGETRPGAHVAYKDLDLGTPEGIEALDRRLAQAVKAVCPDAFGTVDLGFRREVRRCARIAKAQASAYRAQVTARSAPDSAPIALTDRRR